MNISLYSMILIVKKTSESIVLQLMDQFEVWTCLLGFCVLQNTFRLENLRKQLDEGKEGRGKVKILEQNFRFFLKNGDSATKEISQFRNNSPYTEKSSTTLTTKSHSFGLCDA